MPSLKGTRTEQNLKDEFAGESQATRRYLYFAQKADVEGYNDISAVFRSTAEGEAGLLRQVVVEPGRTYFDTNTADHHHFYFEEDGTLRDVHPESLSVNSLPPPPPGAEIARVDVIIRCRRRD